MNINIDKLSMKQIEELVIKKYFELNPDSTILEISQLLGMSERNLYRKLLRLKIKRNQPQKISVSNNIQIDTDIPCPPPYNYPFDKLEVGHSFFVKHTENTQLISLRNKISTQALRYSKFEHQGQQRYTTRFENDGVRVWRIK